jgi:hypothetical protein
MADHSLTSAALRQRREQTIARLCEHFALDHLEAHELEERIDGAHRSATVAELETLLSGLPEIASPVPHEEAATLPAPPGLGRDHQLVVAVMGGAERRGSWSPARNLYVTAVMGGAVLDFREVQLPPGVTEVFAVAIMGGIEIVVPPGMCVESNGIGVMGGFGHAGKSLHPVDAPLPVLRVSGLALMGGVEIREKPSRRLAPPGRGRLGRYGGDDAP